ncbi:hypothetical protein [Thiosulfativibrio zosterae]|uniref:Uncharacterized protein n=1 Tax=Thiosulfativibrio zosterae TaxID=2675053 RepID=A0A6F8PQ13_9GAMM|nr:hypothetical protein [Thiosulfativibrio zosterae]BBP44195.1 hypothetical protein THMIRHAT_19410 [Thiosulfativibrio zosterae]
MRKLFTKEEIVLCTYIAKFGRGYFNEKQITLLENRSEASVKMKVKNIAAMLDEEGLPHSPDVSTLSGVPTGKEGRRTNWDIVGPIAKISKEEHNQICREIFGPENNWGIKK